MSELVWVLIRQDDGDNRYRVGRYATRAEAEQVASTLGAPPAGSWDGASPAEDWEKIYVIEQVVPRSADA